MRLGYLYMIDPTPGRVGFVFGTLGCSVNAWHSREGVGANRVTVYFGSRSRTIPATRQLHRRGGYPYVLGVSGKLGGRTFALTVDRRSRPVPSGAVP